MNIVNKRNNSYLIYHAGVYITAVVTLENGIRIIKKTNVYLDDDTFNQLKYLINNDGDPNNEQNTDNTETS